MASGTIVNVRRDIDDKFYRYRMPLLITKIEGKGNGLKTIIPNMSDIAHALSRPPTYITKFFGYALGTQTSFNEKNDRYIVNGAHDANRLRELLDAFIENFVLCGSCKNPETDLVVLKLKLKNGRRNEMPVITRVCKACGVKTDIDMRHKLTTFILKNLPAKTKRSSRKSKPREGGEENADADADAYENTAESDDELTKR